MTEPRGRHAGPGRIQVSDSGVGIAKGLQDDLFERFTQADVSNTRKYGGAGLGLAISKQLVQLMGGTIGVVSEPDHGSTFWLTVPVEDARLVAHNIGEPTERRAAPNAILRQLGYDEVVS